MREYGKIYTRFWTSHDMCGSSVLAKLLATYLLSSPHTNLIGCFRLPVAYVAADLGIQVTEVVKTFTELNQIGFAVYDQTIAWVLMPKFLVWNQVENPNQAKAAIKLIQEVPPNTEIYHSLVTVIKGFPDPLRKRFGTLPEAFRNQEQEQEQEQKQEQKAVCTEPEKPVSMPHAPSHVSGTLPLVDGTDFEVSAENLEQWQKLYPGIDVKQSLRNMKGWFLGSPTRRKTRRGIMRAIQSWLSQDQDKGGGHRNGLNSGHSAAVERQDASFDAIARSGRKLRASLGLDGPDEGELSGPGPPRSDLGHVDPEVAGGRGRVRPRDAAGGVEPVDVEGKVFTPAR